MKEFGESEVCLILFFSTKSEEWFLSHWILKKVKFSESPSKDLKHNVFL